MNKQKIYIYEVPYKKGCQELYFVRIVVKDVQLQKVDFVKNILLTKVIHIYELKNIAGECQRYLGDVMFIGYGAKKGRTILLISKNGGQNIQKNARRQSKEVCAFRQIKYI